jgi:pimeloyl-ACP methyl ester carboxylesterase
MGILPVCRAWNRLCVEERVSVFWGKASRGQGAKFEVTISMNGMHEEVIHTKLGRIEFQLKGKGLPILFVHGGHSNCREELAHKGFDLEHFQLITPSRPGYGQTPLDGNTTPRQAAALLVALLDYLSIDKVVVYGISAGGLTAIELAAQYPHRVSALILASAISQKWLDPNGATYQTAKRIFRPGVERMTWGMVRLFSRLFPGLIARSFYPQFSKNAKPSLSKEDVQELVTSMQHYQSKSGFINDIDQTIPVGVIEKVVCPTLIIHSENDNSVPLAHARHANEMIANSKLEVLQNKWGHLFWIGADSSASIATTIDFLQARDSS